MAHLDIIRAWKDEEYRLGLSEAERALLPAHPAGLIELTDPQLDQVRGGFFLYFVAAAATVVALAHKNDIIDAVSSWWNRPSVPYPGAPITDA